MIDIHCHILPGLDDGPASPIEALSMARQAVQDGVRHVIATPHFNQKYRVKRDAVLTAVKQFQRELDRNKIDLTVHPGNEVRLEDADKFEDDLQNNKFCLLNDGTRYLLLEQHWLGYNEDTPDLIRRLSLRGITVIVPHPERHFFFREVPALLDQLIAAGAWTQVSADSLRGANGLDARDFAYRLLERNQVHTLATDAHNMTRKPNLSVAYELVEEAAGRERADEIRRRMKDIIR